MSNYKIELEICDKDYHTYHSGYGYDQPKVLTLRVEARRRFIDRLEEVIRKTISEDE